MTLPQHSEPGLASMSDAHLAGIPDSDPALEPCANCGHGRGDHEDGGPCWGSHPDDSPCTCERFVSAAEAAGF